MAGKGHHATHPSWADMISVRPSFLIDVFPRPVGQLSFILRRPSLVLAVTSLGAGNDTMFRLFAHTLIFCISYRSVSSCCRLIVCTTGMYHCSSPRGSIRCFSSDYQEGQFIALYLISFLSPCIDGLPQYVETKYHLYINASAASQLNRAIAHGAEKGAFVLPKGDCLHVHMVQVCLTPVL